MDTNIGRAQNPMNNQRGLLLSVILSTRICKAVHAIKDSLGCSSDFGPGRKWSPSSPFWHTCLYTPMVTFLVMIGLMGLLLAQVSGRPDDPARGVVGHAFLGQEVAIEDPAL